MDMRILKINIWNILLSKTREMICQEIKTDHLSFLSPCSNSGEELNYGTFIISHLSHFANIFRGTKSEILSGNADVVPVGFVFCSYQRQKGGNAISQLLDGNQIFPGVLSAFPVNAQNPVSGFLILF